MGDIDNEMAIFDENLMLRCRSFSIFSTTGTVSFMTVEMIFASYIAATMLLISTLTNDDNNSFDKRSDDKVQNLSQLIVEEIRGKAICIHWIERMGGIMVYEW